ncbi:protein kinase [Bremerella sp. JC817]|uniref:protein kinase domain-containing protein n=1 Tax=Bremerella sp. JC817 TaxID=3231756 RepID=UPI00345A1544
MIALSRETRTLVQAFEEAWFGEEQPDIQAFYLSWRDSVPATEWDSFLHWLVRVDMEFRIRRRGQADCPTVIFLDHYAGKYPDAFRAEQVPDDLLVCEYLARLQTGSVPDLEELLEKFSASRRLPSIARRLAEELEDGIASSLPVIPGYVILAEIGRGGMGVVYSALELRLNRKVAVKLILPDRGFGGVVNHRFLREAQTLAGLDSEKFVPIYDCGEATSPANARYFTMRLISGTGNERPETLMKALFRRRSVEDGLEIWIRKFIEICDAVAIAHHYPGSPILHRDLKPSNIVLDLNGTPWVIDWGLAKPCRATEEVVASSLKENSDAIKNGDRCGELTVDGEIIGTPSYMPPEQANAVHEKVDTTSDVFSLGAILCVILTGKPPYVARTPMQLVAAAQKADLSACRERLRDVREKYLVDVAITALNPNQNARYRTAAELRDALEYWFTNRANRQRQEELFDAKRPLQKSLRAAIVVAAVLLLLGSLGFAWRFYDSHRSEVTRRTEINNASESIEERLASVEADVADGRLAAAAQTLRDINSLKRQDLNEITTAKIIAARQLVEFAVAADELMEERLLSKLDHNLSKKQMVAKAERLLEQAGFSKSMIAPRLRDASPVLQSKVILVANELIEMIPVEGHPELLKGMRSLNPESIAVQLRLSDSPLSTIELTKIMKTLSASDLTPGNLDVLLRRNVEANSDPVRVLRLMEFQHRNNFWLSLYLAILFAAKENAGDLSKAANHKNEAVIWANAALERRPKSAVAMLVMALILDANDQDKLERLSAQIQENHPGSWMRHYVEALAKLSSGDARAAVALFEEANRVKGGDTYLVLRRVELLMALGQPDEVVRILENELASELDRLEVICASAICYLRLEQFAEAREACERLAKDFPSSSRSKIVQAIVLAGLGRVIEANAIYAGVDASEVHDDEYYIGGMVSDLAQGNLDSLYDRALYLSRYGKNFDFWLVRAILDGSLGRFEDAQSDYQRALAWLQRQNGRSFTVMGLQVSDEIPIRMQVVQWYSELDKQTSDKSRDEIEAMFRAQLREPLWGRIKVYSAEYLAIRGDYDISANLFEQVLPPKIRSNIDVNNVDQIIASISEILEVHRPDLQGENLDLSVWQQDIQRHWANRPPAEQAAVFQRLMQFLMEIDLGMFPSTAGMCNLRLAAARSACLASLGKSPGPIGSDQQRLHWRELAIAYLTTEFDSCQQIDISEGAPFAMQNRMSISRRLGQMLTHRDFKSLREVNTYATNPAERARLEQFWKDVRSFYDQIARI